MILSLKNISKFFTQGSETIHVLNNINLELESGETLAILGPSGSGKSTLLSLLAGLDSPSSGEIKIAGKNMTQMSEAELTQLRAEKFGIVFQQYHLFNHLTALENVSLPLELRNQSGSEHSAKKVLEQVGLGHRENHYPSQLSGGENQRVAIARAFITQPQLLLADEPSGSLDVKTGDQVMDLLFNLVEDKKTTMVLVTHNESLALRCKKQLRL